MNKTVVVPTLCPNPGSGFLRFGWETTTRRSKLHPVATGHSFTIFPALNPPGYPSTIYFIFIELPLLSPPLPKTKRRKERQETWFLGNVMNLPKKAFGVLEGVGKGG